MGLDCSHDAFHGAYSAFNRFRQAVAKAAGGSYPPHEDASLNQASWYWDDKYTAESHPGLFELFNHSDCDGEISPENCVLVANDLEGLLPEIEKEDDGGSGHIANAGGEAAVTRSFIEGCRKAAAADEVLRFG